MRRLWIAIALLLICGGLSATEYFTIQKNCDFLTTSLETAENYISSKEYKKAVSFIEATQQKWNKCEKKLNIYLLHDETETITENLSQIKEYAQEKKTDEYMEVSNKTKRQLLRMKQSELPDLENIL